MALLDLYPDIFQLCVGQEFINDVDDVLINEIGPRQVDQDGGIGWYRLQLLFYDGFVQERDILTEAEQVSVIIMYDHDRRAEIAPDQEEQRYSHPDKDPDQQVGKEDGQDRHHEGNELVPSFPVELPE